MLIYSFRFNRKLRHSALLILLLVAVMAAGRLVIALTPETAAASASIKRETLKTEDDRQHFISRLGWQTEPQPAETTEIVIPKKFDDIYIRYNELQKRQGCDLSKWRGKRCMRYSYNILNHPSGEDKVRLNLIVCGSRLIGGDVCSLKLDGFMDTLFYSN